MQYFDLIFDECKKLNVALEDTFEHQNLFFISADISEIIVGLGNNAIVFGYYPERYEYGQIMFLKGISIRMGFNKERQYSVSELDSFIKNNFKAPDMSYPLKTLEEQLNSLATLLEFIAVNKVNWEEKFVAYKKSNTFEW